MTTENDTGEDAAGAPEELAGDVRQMILAALVSAGGSEYLKRQAEETPSAFLALVGKIIPGEAAGKRRGTARTKLSDVEIARRIEFLLACGIEARKVQ